MGRVYENSTVILGGGIIGLSTAYYLALSRAASPLYSQSKAKQIFVIEPSATICAGASSQNSGLLGDFGLRDEVMPLGLLSWDLHNKLAAELNGSDAYDFSGLDIHAIYTGSFDAPHPSLMFPMKEPEDISNLPNWLKISDGWKSGLISNSSHSARLQCEALGVEFLTQHKAVAVGIHESRKTLDSVEIAEVGSPKSVKIPCRSLVISAGSWSAQVFSELFPNARLQLPMAPHQSAANWLLFLNEVVEPINLDMSSFLNGDLHAVSGFASPDKLPETPEQVPTQWNVIDLMKLKASENLKLRNGDDIEVVAAGRAFLPETLSRIPLMTQLPFDKLFLPSSSELGSDATHVDDGNQVAVSVGVFVNTGHFTDGLTLGLGSGKIMSEIIEGKEPSIKISAFSAQVQILAD